MGRQAETSRQLSLQFVHVAEEWRGCFRPNEYDSPVSQRRISVQELESAIERVVVVLPHRLVARALDGAGERSQRYCLLSDCSLLS